MAPVWLIAGREFRAYTATLSFWIALALGPIALALALLLLGGSPQTPRVIQVQAPTPAQAQLLHRAVIEAAALERKDKAAPGAAPVQVRLTADAHGRALLSIDPELKLSPAGRLLVLRTFERDQAQAAAAPGPAVTLQAPPPEPDNSRAVARFMVLMLLWLTLTGSLGMLLQAVVRERATRAREILLAATRPWEIVFGKLVGVGMVSALVLGAWLASAAAPVMMNPGISQYAFGRMLSDPATLAGALGLYALTFVFYGLAIIAVGARARDSASAQNLSRPIFITLLAVFFVALGSMGGGAGSLSWLVYLPPFTPFMLLIHDYPAAVQLAAVTELALAALAAGWLANITLYAVGGGGASNRLFRPA